MNSISTIPQSEGQYSADTTYYPQDRVYNNGSIFASLAEQTGNEPTLLVREDGTYDASDGWMLIAVSGDAPEPVTPEEDKRITALEKGKLDKPKTSGKAGQHLALADADTGETEWVDAEKSEEITVDDVLSYTSENPVQNKAIASKLSSINALIKSLSNETKTLGTLIEKETSDRTTSDISQNERIYELRNATTSLSANLTMLQNSLSNLRATLNSEYYDKTEIDSLKEGIWEWAIQHVKDNEDVEGFLANLTTEDKSNLVAAINEVNAKAGQGGGGGTSDYSALTNKPSIEGVELKGEMSAGDLGLYKSAEAEELIQNISTQLMYMNKEIEGTYATKDALAGKQDTITDLSAIRSGASKGATAVQPSDIVGLATTEDVNASCDIVRAEIPTKMGQLENDQEFLNYEKASGVFLQQSAITQTTGQSTTSVMSQKAVTDLIGDVESILATING